MELRRALIDLGVGLWLCDPAAKAYAAGLKARGKKGGVIACALAHRANRIAYALVRDQPPTTPTAGSEHTWPFLDRCPQRRCDGAVNVERPQPHAGEDERR